MSTIFLFAVAGLVLGCLGKLGKPEVQRFVERKRLGLSNEKHKELRRLVSYDWFTNNAGDLKIDSFITGIEDLDNIERRKITEAYQKLHTTTPPEEYTGYAEKTTTRLQQLEKLRDEHRNLLIPPERRQQLNSGLDTPRELL